MGTKGIEILGLKADQLVEKLNRALADEWLAYYQYWIGAKVVRGPLRAEVVAELDQHAADELRHAGLLVSRIIQLGGTPLLNPQEWFKLTNCGYDAPKNPEVGAVVNQNIKGEQCAIGVYNDLIKFTRDKDPVTFNIVLGILQDEVEHEDDLQAILEDMKTVGLE